MKNAILLITIFCVITAKFFAQDISDEARTYFSEYMDDQSQMKMLMNSLPNIDQCKFVIKDEYALEYFNYVERMKRNANEGETKEEIYLACIIESFTSADLEKGKENYAGGMDDIKEKLQPNLTFYKLTYLKEENASSGMSYKYFVNIDGKWLFFPKPWRAFN